MGYLSASSEKGRQDALDALADLVQRMKDQPPIGWRPLLESYVNNEPRIHVHLRQRTSQEFAGGGDQPCTPDLCATYEWPSGALGDDLEVSIRETWTKWSGDHVGKIDGRIDQVKVAMLVDVPEFLALTAPPNPTLTQRTRPSLAGNSVVGPNKVDLVTVAMGTKRRALPAQILKVGIGVGLGGNVPAQRGNRRSAHRTIVSGVVTLKSGRFHNDHISHARAGQYP